MLQELIHEKINEVFAEYQKAHHITNGDIHPDDALILEDIEEALEEFVERVCAYQAKATFDDLTPSWYIYTDCDGVAHSETFDGNFGEDYFFTKVSKKICFDDLEDITVQKIFYKGKEVEYAGWHPGMKYEYKDLNGNTVWVGYFPEWDH